MLRHLMRVSASVLVVALAIMVALIVCFLATDIGLIIVRHATAPRIHEITTPLEPAVVQDVCQKLALPESHRLCKAGAVVYAPDFFPFIKSAFRPGASTYDEIQQKLGAYRYYCEPPVEVQSLGLTLFTCHYDLNVDRVFPFAFCFTDQGVLYRTYADPYGGD